MTALRSVLRLNAASCLIFGALFVVADGGVAEFIGAENAQDVFAIGAMLLAFAAGLGFVSAQPNPNRWAVLGFAIGDGLWVVSTCSYMAIGILITTGPGIAAALAVNLMVGTFGVLQFRGFRQLSTAVAA